MKRDLKLINFRRIPAFRLDPALTGEEAIILRALAAGHTDRDVCKDLRMDPNSFLRLMRDVREKIGMKDNRDLIAWAKQQITNGDQRIEAPEKYGRLA